jgi:hypothetical protein
LAGGVIGITATVALEMRFSVIYKYEHRKHEEFSFDYSKIKDGECQPVCHEDKRGKTRIAAYACNQKGKIAFYEVPEHSG